MITECRMVSNRAASDTHWRPGHGGWICCTSLTRSSRAKSHRASACLFQRELVDAAALLLDDRSAVHDCSVHVYGTPVQQAARRSVSSEGVIIFSQGGNFAGAAHL